MREGAKLGILGGMAVQGRRHSGSPRAREFVIEIEGFDGDDDCIVVENRRTTSSLEPIGRSDCLFCVGAVGDDGVIRIVDWGYATAEEAWAAWPQTKGRSPADD